MALMTAQPMDAAILSVIVGALLATSSIVMAALTLKANVTRDSRILEQNSQMLLDTVSKQTVDMLAARVSSLEDQNKELRRKVDECQADKIKYLEQVNELRDRNFELMERLLKIDKS